MGTRIDYIARQDTDALSQCNALSLLRDGARFTWGNGKSISTDTVRALYDLKIRIGGYCYYKTSFVMGDDVNTATEAHRFYNAANAHGLREDGYTCPRMCKVLRMMPW